jgi:hypothetical protein
MKARVLSILVFLAIGPSLSGQVMTAKRIFELASLPDDRSVVPEPLQIFIQAAGYTTNMIIATPDGQKRQHSFRVQEKLVRGKYIVTRGRPPGARSELIMVTWYDEDTTTYRKAVCMNIPNPTEVYHSIGIRLRDTHTISWTGLGNLAGSWLSIERQTPEKVFFQEVYLTNGRVTSTVLGESVPTKRPAKRKK